MTGGLRERVPWWFKLGAKIVLSRLPLGYDTWRELGVFKHGRMLDSEYARSVFDTHFQRTRPVLPTPMTVLELGPGDSLATSVLACRAGASHTWLVDAGAFAARDVSRYRDLLIAEGFATGTELPASIDDLLAMTGTTYLTEGLASLRTIPDGAIDLSFSQAVLEHVRLDEFDVTLRELHRVQSRNGRTSHRIDLRDHLASSLNSLRFSRDRWEGKLFSRSGFYTNRLRSSEIRARFEAAGFAIESYVEDRWPSLPMSRRHLHAEFAHFPDEDLRVHGVDLVARKAA